jgi:hypothetical protein
MKIKSILSLYSRIKKHYKFSDIEKSAYEDFADHTTLKSSQDIVLVQCVEDLYYYRLFGLITSALSKEWNIKVEQLVFHSLRAGESKTLMHFLRIRFFLNWISTAKWDRLYSAFCNSIGYQSTSMNYPLGDIIDAYRSFHAWQELKRNDQLIKLCIDDVHVGDLINDSYLRVKPAPTVCIGDAYLWFVIWQAHRDVRRAKRYFSRSQPKIFLTSYTTYIHHGIPARVALKYGVRVFSFGNKQEFAKDLSLNHWTHTKITDNYFNDFKKLKGINEKLAEADLALRARMAGAIDGATAYMEKSAYIETNKNVPDVKGAIVIFLHDFFDSPNGYRFMVFSDFWEWTCYTIKCLENLGINFFVKPHPNQVSLSDVVLSKLIRCFPNVKIISPTVTNKQLVESGMVCAVTVFGTVAHEMAYLGVPTIGCGDNPHIAFDFCRLARSKAEYAEMLHGFAAIEFDKTEMRRQSLIFYYMHNLNTTQEERDLLDAVRNLNNYCQDPKTDIALFKKSLKEISKLEGFKLFISRLVGLLDTGKY